MTIPDDLTQRELRIVDQAAESSGRVLDRKLIAHVVDYHLPEATPQPPSRQVVPVPKRRVVEVEENSNLPPRRTAPITAIPFPDWRLTDTQAARALEMLTREGATLDDAALAIDVPTLVLERALADYRPPYRQWLRERASE